MLDEKLRTRRKEKKSKTTSKATKFTKLEDLHFLVLSYLNPGSYLN